MIDSFCSHVPGGLAAVPGSPPGVRGIVAVALATGLAVLLVAPEGRSLGSRGADLCVVVAVHGLAWPTVASGWIWCPFGYTWSVAVVAGAAVGPSVVRLSRSVVDGAGR